MTDARATYRKASILEDIGMSRSVFEGRVSFARLPYYVGITALFWFLATFMIVPMANTLHAAFFSSGAFEFTGISSTLFQSGRVRTALLNTVWVTVASTFTVGLVGIFQVLVLEYFEVKGRTLLKVGFAIPLVFGSVVAATGYKFTYGPNGVVTHLLQAIYPALPDSWFMGGGGVLFAQTFLLTSFYFLFLRAALRRVDYSTIEAARSLGASELVILRRVVFPVLLPTILAVMLLTVFVSTTSFAAPEFLGGRDFIMISQMILILNSIGRPDMAAYLALCLGAFIMCMILLMQWIESKGSYFGGAKTSVPIQLKRIENPALNALLHLVAYGMLIIYVTPVAVVVLFSFAPGLSIGVETFPSSFTLANYGRVFSGGSAFEPFFNSLRMSLLAVSIGLAATLFAVPIMVKHKNWLTRILDLGFFLPWLVPSVLLAIGLIVTFDRPSILVANFVLVGSFMIVPLGYAINCLPLLVRFIRAAFLGVDPAFDEAGRSLGASGLYRFRRITLPLVAPTALLAGGYMFNDLLTEYPLSAFLYNVNNRPLSIAILESDRSQDPEQAAITLVYSVLIMIFTMAVILVAERFSLGKGPKINHV
jgi:iron(III) transport system permease protein